MARTTSVSSSVARTLAVLGTSINIQVRSSSRSTNPDIDTFAGCACDVPSALYSLSYEQNTDWSRVLPTNAEIESYLLKVAAKYDLLSKMKFRVEVKQCNWLEEEKLWHMDLEDLADGCRFTHRCSILFSAAGQLVYPRELDIPGTETFKGEIFHSARWNSTASVDGKDVIVIGNGCTAAQIVPAIVKKTKSLTQIVRSKHWVFPPVDMPYPSWLRWGFKNLPGLLRLHRLQIFLWAEWDFQLFPMTERAAKMRNTRRENVERYMKTTAPAKYHDLLIPDFDVGCKRRIFDSGYLKSLHENNLTLTMAKALEVVPEGIRTTDGVIKADMIVLANGFRTNEFISPMRVYGRGGIDLSAHWEKAGGPEAYNCSVLNGFPNFFMILGPNAATGHTSAIMASENTINYALRVLKPFMDGTTTTVEIKADAELSYAYQLQADLKKTVWNSGCRSWYVKANDKEGSSWNAMSYPYSQAHFWYRSLFPTWKDWNMIVSSSSSNMFSKTKLTRTSSASLNTLITTYSHPSSHW